LPSNCDGSTSLGALKKCTKAATACGGCAPLVTQVLKSELQRQGVTVNNHICEHFPYSRQELYHLVRVNEIKTFDDLIQQHGHGLGCDICKPTAANILASCWNDFVLNQVMQVYKTVMITTWVIFKKMVLTLLYRVWQVVKSLQMV
jgi:nitrite reductase (NADH) large subunit